MAGATFAGVATALALGGCTKGDDGASEGSGSTGGGGGSGTSSGTSASSGTSDGSSTGAVDPCSLLAGATFTSVDALECGLGPNGVELCHWTISFTASTYEHSYSDVQDSGTYSCAGGVITSQSSAFDLPAGGGTIDAEGGLLWGMVAYLPI